VPWAARKLVRWSAHRRYAPPSRAELRAEELAAYIDDRPGRLFKLITALGFAAAAVVNRKVALGVEAPNPLWWPTTLNVPVHYEEDENFMITRQCWNHPKDRAVSQAWKQLTDEIREAASQIGVGSLSSRRCIKKPRRVTQDDHWELVARNLDLLKSL
jgi:hypothetical protein